MAWFLKDVKDSDKVGLLLLYSGLVVTGLATCGYLLIIFHAGLDEHTIDRALSSVKDFFGVGLSLITAAMGVLRFQSKSNGNGGSAPVTDSAPTPPLAPASTPGPAPAPPQAYGR